MWEDYLKSAIEAGKLASKEIMRIYHTPFDVEIKEDNSPVTLADKTADKIIREYLSKKYPDHAFLTEESDDDLERLDKEFIWIVDPVDGTKDFVAKDGGFTTNIALCHRHELVVGVVVVPATGVIYYASKGEGAFFTDGEKVERMHVSDRLTDLTCYTSVFHHNDFEQDVIDRHRDKIARVEKLGSSIKVCEIAHGFGDCTFRLTPNTKEWDTAACQIILEEAGGIFVEPDGAPITYNRKDVYNHKGYTAVNRIENLFK